MRVRVLNERAVALEQRDQHHVRIELVRHPEPDRVPERLQLRRRLANVVPRRRLDPHLAPKVFAEVDRVRHVVLGEAVPLLRLRVVTALEADLADLAELVADLLDDLLMVDHLVLEAGLRGEVAEDVVPTPGRDLRLGARRELSEVDVVDLHVRVVLVAPVLRVGLVEPDVVRRHEVTPLDDLERVLVLPVDVLRDRRGRNLRQRPRVGDQEPAETAADHLPSGEASGET